MRGLTILLALLLVGGMALGVAACGTSTVSEETAQETAAAVFPTVEVIVEPTVEATVAPVTNTVLSALEADGRFGMFIELLTAAGLTETLTAETPVTVFAPTDDAVLAVEEEIAAMDADQLKAMLLGHEVDRMLTLDDLNLMADTDLEMADGSLQAVTIDGLDVLVGPAKVLPPEISASNGAIFPIDVVLVPTVVTEPTPEATA